MTHDSARSLWRTPGLVPLIALTMFAFSGYATLLPVVPLWAVAAGATPTGAGAVNGVLLLFTAITPAVVPAALRRWGWGPVLVTALVLVGAPSLGYLVATGLPAMLALAAVRGVGLGVLTVSGTTAVYELLRGTRPGAGIGAYGLSVALPNLLLLPTGPVLVDRWGFVPSFVLGALPLAGIPAAVLLARRLHHDDGLVAEPLDRLSRRRDAFVPLLPPIGVLVAVTTAGGAVVSFAPQLIASPGIATGVLTAIGATGTLGRWLIGDLADRRGADVFLAPLLGLSVAALLATAWAAHDEAKSWPTAATMVTAALVFGLSYGALQNLTLVVAFARAPAGQHRIASAVWNGSFDIGTGLGSVVLGAAGTWWGFGTGLFVVAGLTSLAVPLTWRRRS